MATPSPLAGQKVAVITGASGGIGLACAQALEKDGYQIVCLSRHSGPVGRHLPCDVSDAEQVKAAFSQLPRVDLLVNNAGFGISGPIETTLPQDAQRLFQVNYFGVLHCVQAALPALRHSRGRIINISSMGAPMPLPFQSFYSASKSAVNALTLALANEVRPMGVTVTALMPGDVRTGFTAAREKNPEDKLYGPRFARSLSVMEHDERNGMEPQVIGRTVARLARARSVSPLYTAGFTYKAMLVLNRLLPLRWVNRIIGWIYAK